MVKERAEEAGLAKWSILGPKWSIFWGQKSKNFDFFFGSQMGFWVVWGWFGVFINGFWTHLVVFWVACVSKWLNRR